MDTNEWAALGIEYSDGNETLSETILDTNELWERRILRFKTAPDRNFITIFAEKSSPGAGFVYVDDMGLQLVEDTDSWRQDFPEMTDFSE